MKEREWKMDIGNLVVGVLVGVIYCALGLAMRIKPHSIKYGGWMSRPLQTKKQLERGSSFGAGLMMLFGILLVLIGVICSLWVQGTTGLLVVMGAVVLLAVLAVILVEGSLKKNRES